MKRKFFLLTFLFYFQHLWGQEFTWVNNNKVNRVYLLSHYLVSFEKVQNLSNSSIEFKDYWANAFLYKVSSSAEDIWKGLKKSEKEKFFPVFSNTSNGPPEKVLLSKVAITFKKDWDESKIRKWCSRQGREIEKTVQFKDKKVWIIKTRGWTRSLHIAEILKKKDFIKKVIPQWWIPFTVKR